MKTLLMALVVVGMLFMGRVEAQVSPSDWSGSLFNCTMISTATTLVEITGCAAPTGGLRYYITAINWSSSIISTTANFMLVRSGTGTNCGTGTVSHYAGFIQAAFSSVAVVLPTPIKIPAGHALCFIHPGAGTRNINVSGFLAP